MVNQPADANLPSQPTKPRRRLSGRLGDWLFSQRHFRFKLLSGTTVGVAVIIFLVGVFLVVSLRDHYQDSLRSHTISVIQLSSVVENDIASLESSHRGFLLTGKEDYVASFDKKRALIKRRIEELAGLILESPNERKRVMKVQEIVRQWLNTVADPEIKARRSRGTALPAEAPATPDAILGSSLLGQARDILQSIEVEEQIALNQRMHEQEWATQSAQILNFLPKLDRAVIEMQKEKRGYLLT